MCCDGVQLQLRKRKGRGPAKRIEYTEAEVVDLSGDGKCVGRDDLVLIGGAELRVLPTPGQILVRDGEEYFVSTAKTPDEKNEFDSLVRNNPVPNDDAPYLQLPQVLEAKHAIINIFKTKDTGDPLGEKYDSERLLEKLFRLDQKRGVRFHRQPNLAPHHEISLISLPLSLFSKGTSAQYEEWNHYRNDIMQETQYYSGNISLTSLISFDLDQQITENDRTAFRSFFETQYFRSITTSEEYFSSRYQNEFIAYMKSIPRDALSGLSYHFPHSFRSL